MVNPMVANPDMVMLAREAEGLTIREFADKLKISHSTVSRYESGLLPIPDDVVQNTASLLNRPTQYFYRSGRTYPASGLFHRKRARISMRELNRIHAYVNELRLQAASLLHWAEIESDNQFHRIDMREFGGPEGAARELRRLWQMPTGPVRSVVGAIESAGGVVFRCSFRGGKVDGISQWPIDDPDMPPVFFFNEEVPGDRARFTLSHEIGHLALHHLPSSDVEADADRFAAEFLMPADEISSDLKRMTVEKAADLKSWWKVSMAAIIRRARDLKQIDGARYLQLIKRMSALGYRKCEPIPIPAEEPQLFSAMFDVNRNHFRRTDDELIEILCVNREEFDLRFGRGTLGLRLVV